MNLETQIMNRKTTFLSFYCLFIVAIGQTINAQQIYTNGPISTGATSTNSTVAPVGYTWSELQTPNTTLGASGFNNNALTNDFSIADDFVVPTGETWNLTSVEVFGYQTGYAGTTIPIDAIKVRIWNGDPSVVTSTIVFGDMTTNVLNATNSSEAFVYRTSATTGTTRKIWKFTANVTVSLPAGTYWLEYQTHATNDASVFFPPVTILNTLSSPTWNGKQRNGATWAALLDGGSTNQLAAPFNFNGAVLASEKYEFEAKVSIYPNPAGNSMTVSDGSKSEEGLLEIFDITGRVVKSLNSSFNSDIVLDVSDLNTGNYILKLKSENGSTVKKFVKL